MPSALAAFGVGAALALLLLRLLLAVVQWLSARRRSHVRTMIVLGSGGHTAEMLALLQGFDLSLYSPRCYVVAATDAMSGHKAAVFEAAAAAAGADEEAPGSAAKRGRGSTPGRSGTPVKSAAAAAAQQQQAQQQAVRRSPRVAAAARREQRAAAAAMAAAVAEPGRRALPGTRSPESPAKRRFLAGGAQQAQQAQQARQPYSVAVIPRSREVGQSWRSTVPSTLKALWAAVSLMVDHQPDLVLVNGPGTCIPIAATAFLFRLLGLCGGRVAYIESIARVYRLSLSGKILYHSCIARPFFVQWEELRERYPRAVYAGRLM